MYISLRHQPDSQTYPLRECSFAFIHHHFHKSILVGIHQCLLLLGQLCKDFLLKLRQSVIILMNGPGAPTGASFFLDAMELFTNLCYADKVMGCFLDGVKERSQTISNWI